MWALRKPNGSIVVWTCDGKKAGATFRAARWLEAAEYQIGSVPAFPTNADTMRRAKRLGYRVVRCKLVEVTK